MLIPTKGYIQKSIIVLRKDCVDDPVKSSAWHGYIKNCSREISCRWSRGVTRGERGTHSPVAEKAPQYQNYFLQYSIFASERPQFRTWGRQTCFLPRTPPNLVTPLRWRQAVDLADVQCIRHEPLLTKDANTDYGKEAMQHSRGMLLKRYASLFPWLLHPTRLPGQEQGCPLTFGQRLWEKKSSATSRRSSDIGFEIHISCTAEPEDWSATRTVLPIFARLPLCLHVEKKRQHLTI